MLVNNGDWVLISGVAKTISIVDDQLLKNSFNRKNINITGYSFDNDFVSNAI